MTLSVVLFFLEDTDSLSQVSSTGSSGVEEEEDEEESGTLLRQHFDTLGVAANGTTSALC